MARPGVPACSASERGFPGPGERQRCAGAGRRGGTGARVEAPRGPGLACALPAPRHSCPWGRTLCRSHVPPPSSWLTQPLTCKTPSAAHAGAQSLGALGFWLAPLAQVEVKAGHRATSSQLLSPDPVASFAPQSQEHSPADIHTWLGGLGGLDCSHYGFWWKSEQRCGREGLPPHIYCRDAQPRSGPAQEGVGGLVQPLVLTTHPGPR